MFYREVGQFKTSYAADQAIFPIRQDRIGLALILLDMSLPDMSGIDVLQALATHVETSAVPVVVLSANAMVGDAEIARLAGACDYWTKPIAAQALREGLARHLSKAARPRGRAGG